jgi:hypothetical protein
LTFEIIAVCAVFSGWATMFLMSVYIYNWLLYGKP